jgi:subtilisin family serine protease
MLEVRYGGKEGYRYMLDISESHLAVRTVDRRPLTGDSPADAPALSARAHQALRNFDPEWRVPTAGVEVLRTATAAERDEARIVLKDEPAVQFAGRVVIDPVSKRPILYTENFFVKFQADTNPQMCERLLAARNLTIKRPLAYARNAYFVAAAEGTGLAVFDIANELLALPEVELCHPELIRESRARNAFPQQWHLAPATIGGHAVNAHAAVVDAWARTMGEGITIAVIDTGIDIDHEEFRDSGKVVSPRDVTLGNDDPRPGSNEKHGTSAAGVACASGKFGASGVAPRARLMPIRLQSELGSQAEADAFAWAATHGADVISNSWGPIDGDWTDPTDPQHNAVFPLPDSTRTAIEFAVTQGRSGKGCVICWAAGNGNESVDNDGYASYPKVIAVAACNDGGTRSAYSDMGKAVWCAFPSNNGFPSLTTGIWTTDVSGKRGYNAGTVAKGDAAGNYTNSFGGTSSACPGVAGTVALILSRNPDLRWDEVKDILRRSSDQVDAAHGNYDAQGHSPMYGYGRVNARRAVDLAQPVAPVHRVVRRVQPNLAIRDFQQAVATIDITDTLPVIALRANIDIEHTYIGDLEVTLQPPPAMNAGPIRLHAREGGSTDNIQKVFDGINIPALQTFAGKSINGTWTLLVADDAAQDEGVLRSFALEIDF